MIVLHDRMQDTCITYTCTAVYHECQMFPGTTRHGLLYKAMSVMWDCGCQLAWEQGYCVNNPCIPYHYSHGTHKDHCYHYSWVVDCINWLKHVSASGLCIHFIFSLPTHIKHRNAVVMCSSSQKPENNSEQTCSMILTVIQNPVFSVTVDDHTDSTWSVVATHSPMLKQLCDVNNFLVAV